MILAKSGGFVFLSQGRKFRIQVIRPIIIILDKSKFHKYDKKLKSDFHFINFNISSILLNMYIFLYI